MDMNNTGLDEETILNNIKNMFDGNWDDILKYYEKVIKFDNLYYYTVCDAAAHKGHLEILKYAHENECRWDCRTCANAALGGHLEILKYARANGCIWNEQTCTCAARNGHLEVLKYAHDNGCRWSYMACARAAMNGHLDILYYLYDNEAPYYIFWDIHPNCKEFFDTFGKHWKKGDYTLNHSYLKPAKNKI